MSLTIRKLFMTDGDGDSEPLSRDDLKVIGVFPDTNDNEVMSSTHQVATRVPLQG